MRADGQPQGCKPALFAAAVAAELDCGDIDRALALRRSGRAIAVFPVRFGDGHGAGRHLSGKRLTLGPDGRNRPNLLAPHPAHARLNRRGLRDETQEGEKGENDALHRWR